MSKNRVFKIVSTWVLVFAMLAGICPVAYAKAKAPKLSAKEVSLAVGASKKVKVKNKPSGAKASWASKSKKVAKVNKKGKITAVAEGKTKVICTLKYKSGKKKVTKKLKVTVTVKAGTSATAAAAVATTAAASVAKATTAPALATATAPVEAPTEVPTEAPTEAPTEEPSITAMPYDNAESMEWWTNAKFGMFIHFGAYSEYANGEWAMCLEQISKEDYETNIASKFNPTNFDADAITDYAVDAGMKYIVITAKHHEGFSMWDTQVDSFTDTTGEKMYSLQKYTPFGETGRDVLKELKDSCDEKGLKFGLYYSIIDWHHASQPTIGNGGFTEMASMEARADYIEDMKAQLKELVDNYDPAILWFDGDWTGKKNNPTLKKWWTAEDGMDLWNYCKTLKDGLIVNERLCRGFDLGDYDCPENQVPKLSAVPDRPWESCRSMNDAWGYKESEEDNYIATNDLIKEYVQAVARGGNYLLNLGPKGDGTVAEGAKNVLAGFGDWMDKNSESIYNTTRIPFEEEPVWGTYTQKDNVLYAHVLDVPSDNTVILAKLDSMTVDSVEYVGSDEKVTYLDEGDSITVTLSEDAIDSADTVIKVTYK